MDEVKDMGNIIKTEFLKLKRYSVIKAGIIMTVLSPLLSLFYSTANGGQTWTFDYFMQQVMISNCTLFSDYHCVDSRFYDNKGIYRRYDEEYINNSYSI